MLDPNFSPWPSFTEEEIEAVQRVLKSNRVNYWTGEECRHFEKEFASWCGATYGVALANGTLALEAALKALYVGPGDEVVVTPRTFIASVSCVVSLGATPVFADVDRESGNLTAKTIAEVITSKTKAVICVHLAGWPCDMDPIMELARKHNFKVIEDCAQAHGARYKGRSVGTIGDIGAWSFCQDKIMTTGGEGGMVTTNNESLWRSMWALKDHGKNYEAVYERVHPPGFRWLHDSFGSNWRMLEIQAAIGRVQLTFMSQWSAKRNSNALFLADAIRPYAGEGGPIRLPPLSCGNCVDQQLKCYLRNQQASFSGCVHANYKFYLYVRPQNLKPDWNRDRIQKEIISRGVPCYAGSCSEVYMEKAFEGTSWRPRERLAVARELGETSLMFLIHPTLTSAEIQKTQQTLTDVLKLVSTCS